MCGISGFLDTSLSQGPEALQAQARRMADTLRHRGPDDEGAWCDARFGIAFGHRRLSIIDLSQHGHQPMTSACGRYVVCYNGEIYNFQALRAELEAAGHRFRGHSDTEVLVTGFSAWGVEETLRRLNGMFAFAVWDDQQATLHLARDPLGEKPLYYGWAGRVFLFASELKALLAHPAFEKVLDRQALTGYFRHGYIPAPHSIFQGIRKLPPGTRLALAARPAPGDMPAPQPFWDMRQIAERHGGAPLALPEAEVVEQLEDLLRDSVALRMISDVPLGAFLSGGVDSSTVVALMQAQSTQPVRTFTIGFRESGFDEAEHARAVAAHLGTAHTELTLTPGETREVIPRLPALYDEPFADASQIPTHLVSQLARRHVTVSLSGDGGDELFGGYERYDRMFALTERAGRMPAPLARLAGAAASAAQALSPDALLEALGGVFPPAARLAAFSEKTGVMARYLRSGNPNPLYRRLVSQWVRPERLVLGGRDLEHTPFAWNLSGNISDVRQRMMLLDTVTYLPDDILVKVDRASMGVSLESRIPLLDPRVVEFAWRIPAGLKFREGRAKWALRQVLYKHVPRELIERPKMGFGVPIGAWLRGPLREWGEALLDGGRLRREGILRPAPVRRAWRAHQAGAHHEYLLWDVLMFQAWLETTLHS